MSQPWERCERRLTITGEYLIEHPRSFDTCLRDGRWVRIRPIVDTDKDAMEQAFERMSARSRYYRFHSGLPRLSEDQLRYLTEVDQHNHVAWAAFSLDEPGRPGIATIRFVRDPKHPRDAEIAVTIVDDFQGVGLGRILVDTVLLSALESQIERLVAYVVPENQVAVNLFRSVGGKPGEVDAGLLRIDIPVTNHRRTYRHSGEIPRLRLPDPLLQ